MLLALLLRLALLDSTATLLVYVILNPLWVRTALITMPARRTPFAELLVNALPGTLSLLEAIAPETMTTNANEDSFAVKPPILAPPFQLLDLASSMPTALLEPPVDATTSLELGNVPLELLISQPLAILNTRLQSTASFPTNARAILEQTHVVNNSAPTSSAASMLALPQTPHSGTTWFAKA